ncbi:VIT family protein [Nocardia sp. CNY236]|uniref:VIT1/CCC1 transporter family protein n=1 Tax=Nocardia sp. CNY236 TaxID=1169152 RepID=UPI000407A8A9|nr:VIT family protein [Nocardia sp. CNY236]
MDRTIGTPGPSPHEPHGDSFASRLNWLRAGVLGANDGIVSTAGLVVGVAAVTTDTSTLLAAGIAGLTAGAISMAVGEYVSVSTQRDSERALLATERRELRDDPDYELVELTEIYRAKGLTPQTARAVAEELTAHDALTAHAEAELGLNPTELTNPWWAAGASAVAFVLGALLPLLAIVLLPTSVRVPVTFAAVLTALALTGSVSARLGGSSVGRAVVRVVVGGALAMAVTYGIGELAGVAGI